MKRFRTSRTALPLLAVLLLLLSACGAEPSQPEGGADVQQPPQAEELRIETQLRELHRTGRRTAVVEVQLRRDEETFRVRVLCVRA